MASHPASIITLTFPDMSRGVQFLNRSATRVESQTGHRSESYDVNWRVTAKCRQTGAEELSQLVSNFISVTEEMEMKPEMTPRAFLQVAWRGPRVPIFTRPIGRRLDIST